MGILVQKKPKTNLKVFFIFKMDDESRAKSPVLEKKRTLTNHCSPFHIILSIIVVLVTIGGSYLLTISEDVLEAEEVFE